MRRPPCVRDYSWYLFDVGHSVGKLGDRFRKDHLVVEALERVRLSVAQGRRGGDAEYR